EELVVSETRAAPEDSGVHRLPGRDVDSIVVSEHVGMVADDDAGRFYARQELSRRVDDAVVGAWVDPKQLGAGVPNPERLWRVREAPHGVSNRSDGGLVVARAAEIVQLLAERAALAGAVLPDVGAGHETGDPRARIRLDARAQRLHGTRLELVEELVMPDDREYEAPRVGQLLGIQVQDRVELGQIPEGER